MYFPPLNKNFGPYRDLLLIIGKNAKISAIVLYMQDVFNLLNNHKKIVLLKYASITVRNGVKTTLWYRHCRDKERYQYETTQFLTNLAATWKSSAC